MGQVKGALALLGILALALARATVFLPEPRTGVWSVAASLERPRGYGTALVVDGGKILVFGGLDLDDPDVTNTTTELIDPATAKVTTLSGSVAGRLHQTATLSKGRLVVAGGVIWSDGRFSSTDRVDVFVSAIGKWLPAKPLFQARSDHGAAALADGRILVTGGNYNATPLESTEIYDPAANAWRPAAPLAHPRLRFSISTLTDGRVLVAGGLDGKGRPLASSEIYDPRADAWTAGPDLSVPRVQHVSVDLPGGDILFIGGQSAASGTAERYDRRTGTFVYAGTLGTPRLVEQAAVLPDGRVLVAGGSFEKPGRSDWVPFGGAEVWDPRANAWAPFASPSIPRALGTLVTTPFGLYLIGGIGAERAPQSLVERLTFK